MPRELTRGEEAQAAQEQGRVAAARARRRARGRRLVHLALTELLAVLQEAPEAGLVAAQEFLAQVQPNRCWWLVEQFAEPLRLLLPTLLRDRALARQMTVTTRVRGRRKAARKTKLRRKRA